MSVNDPMGTPPPNDNPPPSAPPPGSDDNMQSMLCWLLSIFIGFISPIIFMLTGKERPKVYANAMQCLTFCICEFIAFIVFFIISIPLAFITCGLGSFIVFIPWVIAVIFKIMGTIEANKGNVYEPPLTRPLAKSWFKV